MMKFFIDTAKLELINKIWSEIQPFVPTNSLTGITTNPKAVGSINITTIKELKAVLKVLASRLSEIRGDNDGIVYTQLPSSLISVENAEKWLDNLLSERYDSKIGIKVAPRQDLLTRLIDSYGDTLFLNVTGVTDALTAIKCFTWDIEYVSILFGRLEEEGANVADHVKYIHSANISKIIAGSMRTFDGLKRSVELGMVPTIGEKVWNEVFNGRMDDFTALSDKPCYTEDVPTFGTQAKNVADNFWKEMDAFGETLYKEILS